MSKSKRKVVDPKKYKTYYYCCVPKCGNTTVSAPDKLFFSVPLKAPLRQKWMQAMKRAPERSGPKSAVYCCDDHFDIENDMENYIRFKLVGQRKMLKKGVLPHKFECQTSFEMKKVMEKLKTMCRMCLSSDVPLRDIVNTCIQDTYEALTKITLVTEDSRPIQACYICYAMLCNSYRLKVSCRRSEELLSEVLSSAEPLSDHLQPFTKKLDNSEITHIECSGETCEDLAQYIKDQVFINTDIKQEELEDLETDPLEHNNIKLEENHDSYEIQVTTDGSSELMKNEQEISIKKNIIQHETTSNQLKANRMSKKNNSKKVSKTKNSQATNKKSNKNINSSNGLNKRQLSVVCNKAFGKKRVLINHPVIHTGEMTFQCDECKRCYSTKASLRQHMQRVHNGNKPHKCEVCAKAFFAVKDLKTHEQIHNVDNCKFQCDVCKKIVRRAFRLRQHMRIHVGEKRYKCKLCEKDFVRLSDLNIHKHVHTTNNRSSWLSRSRADQPILQVKQC